MLITPPLGTRLNWGLYAQIDASRQWQGRMIDALGLGPVRTPFRVVLTMPALTLLAYQQPVRSRPALLLVPAPIKRPYIWDMLPRISVVQRCLEKQLQVYLVQWEPPGDVEQGFGLCEYADRLILACLDSIRNETGQECVASAELGQPEAEKMRDFARLQEACGRSEAHEQRRT